MKPEHLKPIRDVAHALYLSELARVRTLVEQEMRVRSTLDKLNEQASLQLGISDPQDAAMRLLGADLVWSEFIARNRRRLNGELAVIVAQKLTQMNMVRLSFGRYTAIDELVSSGHQLNVYRRKKQEEQRLTETGRSR